MISSKPPVALTPTAAGSVAAAPTSSASAASAEGQHTAAARLNASKQSMYVLVINSPQMVFASLDLQPSGAESAHGADNSSINIKCLDLHAPLLISHMSRSYRLIEN
jgi:hypothetical protein